MDWNLERKLAGRVLIVEDDPTTGTWLTKRLKKEGIESSLVDHYVAAVEAAKSQIFHAVLTDIYLEGDKNKEEGLKIATEFSKMGYPVIIMTSAADLEIARDGMNHGASYLLEKPFEIEKLISVLTSVWEEPRGLQALLERFLDIHKLTPKEKEISRLLVKGLSNKEVASVTGNTEKTIKYHLTSIFEKCGVHSRTEMMNAIFPT